MVFQNPKRLFEIARIWWLSTRGSCTAIAYAVIAVSVSTWLVAQEPLPPSNPFLDDAPPRRHNIRATVGKPTSAKDWERLDQPALESVRKESFLVEQVIDPELVFHVDPLHSKVLRARWPIQRLAITNPDILEVNEFSNYEIEIIGLKPGETTLTMWFDQEGQIEILRYLVRIGPDDSDQRRRELQYGQLQDRLNEIFPNSQIQLIPLEDKLIVRGQVQDAKEARDILQSLGRDFAQGNGGNGGQARNNGNQAQRLDLDELTIVNLLAVPGEHQVMLKVRIAELTRNAARELGLDFAVSGDTFDIASTISSASNITAILDSGDINLFLRAFSTHGYGKILAEPTLVTISGQTATFLAGGEFAVPTAVGIDGIGAATTTFRGFGTQLQFTPTVIDKDRIRLQVSPSFSTLNTDASVNGIPGLNERSVNTTVDLREGQWLAIAGLIQDEQGGQRSLVPFLGQLPLVGAAFASQNTSRNETELVVLVSPQLVHPLEQEQAPLFLPGMEVKDPTDRAFFLQQQIEGNHNVDHRSTIWPSYQKKMINALHSGGVTVGGGAAHGSQYCDSEQFYISGPVGFSE